MADTLTVPDVQAGDPELADDDPRYAHIVGPLYDDDGNKIQGRTRVVEAAINGTPITALCGYTWVPSRDPQQFPVCPQCKAIVERSGD